MQSEFVIKIIDFLDKPLIEKGFAGHAIRVLVKLFSVTEKPI